MRRFTALLLFLAVMFTLVSCDGIDKPSDTSLVTEPSDTSSSADSSEAALGIVSRPAIPDHPAEIPASVDRSFDLTYTEADWQYNFHVKFAVTNTDFDYTSEYEVYKTGGVIKSLSYMTTIYCFELEEGGSEQYRLNEDGSMCGTFIASDSKSVYDHFQDYMKYLTVSKIYTQDKYFVGAETLNGRSANKYVYDNELVTMTVWLDAEYPDLCLKTIAVDKIGDSSNGNYEMTVSLIETGTVTPENVYVDYNQYLLYIRD